MRAVAIGVLAVGCFATPAFAGNAIELRYGERGDVSLRAASVAIGELWSRSGTSWSMTLQPVLEGGRFRNRGTSERESLSYGGLGLGFRVVRASGAIRPYLEAGVGGTLFSETRLAERDFSTRFQFTEWIGVGLQLSEHFTIGWRYSHFSNASIKQPNDGIDIQQIVIGARF